MKRRGMTVLVGCLLLALLSGMMVWVPVSYVELGPGPTYDTLGSLDDQKIITVTGADVSTSAGQLRMVTVSVRSELTLLDALRGWWDGGLAVVPREFIYPEDQTEEEVQEENTAEFEASQNSAEMAALRELGYPVQVTVASLTEGYPAASVLAVGDVITAVDGTAVTSAEVLTGLITQSEAGASHEVTYTRGGQTATATISTQADSEGVAKIGISVELKQEHPFTLSFQLDDVGGPSAGLMFTLAIVDTLTTDDLTGGKIIAGTGTIDDDGVVGAIGGIEQKLIGAKRDGAEYFLTPADNCAEAVANAQSNMPLVKVSSLQDALDALTAIRENRTPTLCSE